MIQSYPLTLEGEKFYTHSVVGIYPLQDNIAYIYMFVGNALYALLDTFSADFNQHTQCCLPYYEQETFAAHDAVCYWEADRFFLNTKRYIGFENNIVFGKSIAKIIEIRDTKLIDRGSAPAPVQQIYNDSKGYTFGEYDIYMASPFVMECQQRTSGKVCWRLKLSAHLYTEIEEQDGILYFGTAGKGGRFYGVFIVDGSVAFSYNTGGTVRFTWYKEYIVLADRKGKPVLLDAKNGTEILKINFGKYKITVDQFLLIRNSRLYAVASNVDMLYAVCVDL